MLLSGKAVAEKMLASLAQRVAVLKAQGIHPRLEILSCTRREADLSYQAGIYKRAEALGIQCHTQDFSLSAPALLASIQACNEDKTIHGVLLLRPLPPQLAACETALCSALRPEKDVDGMTGASNAGVYLGRGDGFAPCTAQACMEILAHYDIECCGKHAVVVGRSPVIGKPVAMLLLAKNATVTICHSKTADLAAYTRQADILVLCAGQRGLITKDHVRPGQIILDVSVNVDPQKQSLCGDAVFEEVSPIVQAITPVPGGVGSVTNLILLRHVVQAAEHIG